MSHVATITVDHTKVDADLTDFVVAVINNSDAGWAALYAAATEGGGDLRIFKSDDVTELPRELVSFSVSAQTGEIHIKYTGTLSSTVDTDIHFYADGVSSDYAVTDTYGRNAVWSAYTAVYHLNQDPSGTAPQIIDSTGNSNNLTSEGAMTTADLVASKLKNGIDLDGSNDKLSLATSAMSGNTQFTMQSWLYSKNISTRQRVIWKGDGLSFPTEAWGLELANAGSGELSFHVFNTGAQRTFISSTGFVPLNTWIMVHAKMTTSASTLYKNGVSIKTGTVTAGTPTSTTKKFAIGNGELTTLYANAIYDEFRYTTADISTSQALTEYNNQNSPTTFYSVVAVATSPNVTVTPAAQSLTASTPVPSVLTGTTVAPSTQSVVTSIPAYTISLPKTVAVATQEMTASVPVYVIDAGGNVTLVQDAQVLTASIPTYSLVYDKIVMVNTQVATVSIPAYSINIGTAAVVTPDAQSATLTIPAYSVTAQRSIIIETLAQVLTLSLPTLSKVGGVWTKRARSTDSTWSRRSVNNE